MAERDDDRGALIQIGNLAEIISAITSNYLVNNEVDVTGTSRMSLTCLLAPARTVAREITIGVLKFSVVSRVLRVISAFRDITRGI